MKKIINIYYARVMFTALGQSDDSSLHGGWGQAGAGFVASITIGAHLGTGIGRFHLAI